MREISFWQFSNKSEILFGLELHTIHMLCTKKLMNFANNDCDQQKFARSWELQCMKTAFIDSCAYKLSLWMLGGTEEGNSHLEQMYFFGAITYLFFRDPTYYKRLWGNLHTSIQITGLVIHFAYVTIKINKQANKRRKGNNILRTGKTHGPRLCSQLFSFYWTENLQRGKI